MVSLYGDARGEDAPQTPHDPSYGGRGGDTTLPWTQELQRLVDARKANGAARRGVQGLRM